MKCKCNNELFRIIEKYCEGCEYNGAYDEENGYIHDEEVIKKKGLERTEAFDEGNCLLGENHGNGCFVFDCSKCHHKTNMPLIDD